MQLYAGRPWSPEIVLPTRVITNIANKTYINSIEALIEVGGWSRNQALRHGEELLSLLQAVDQRECNRCICEKQRKIDERQELKRMADAARLAERAEAKRRKQEERLSRPKKPRPSRAKAKVAGHVAAEIGGPGKENVPPYLRWGFPLCFQRPRGLSCQWFHAPHHGQAHYFLTRHRHRLTHHIS